MEVLHEWKLAKYGKQGVQNANTWMDVDGESITLKIVSARKLIVSSKDEILVKKEMQK